MGQYVFALELARILNCKGDKTTNCQCTNCKWIRNFEHPSVINVSQIHSKGEDDDSKTVISVKQIREIESNLLLSSDYHRFFIFFSSSKLKEEQNILSGYEELNYKNNIDYTIEPLKTSTFNFAAPNALLKSIEEPPKNTTFVFLTNSRENILQTIVSRCLVFKLPEIRKTTSTIDVGNIFSLYPNIDYKNALMISEQIINKINLDDISLVDFLNGMLEYLKELLKSNLNNGSLYLKIQRDINLINEAIKMKNATMQDKIIVDTLLLRISRGY